MAPLSKTTSEEFEQDQRAIEGADENKPFITRVSVTIALLAVIGVTLGSLESIETSASSSASNTALLHQDRATDAWNAFEAKNIKAMLQTLVPAAGVGQAGAQIASIQAAPDRHPDKDANGLASFAREQERLSEDKLQEAERHGERHHVLTLAVTLIQVGIAVATISIIARGQHWPWYGAMALGLAGILAGAYAYR